MENNLPPEPSEAGKRSHFPIARAAGRLDAAAWLAMLCIFMGWFFIDTLVVTVGPLQHGIRFYDFAAIIGNPVQLFVGVDHEHAFEAIPFALICLGCLLSPLAPYIWNDRAVWLAYVMPLGLILVCALLIYARTSGELISTPGDAAAISSDLARLANDLFHRGAGLVTQRISVGAGGYLALIGSIFLAVRGVRRYRDRLRTS